MALWEQLVKVNIYITDFAFFAELNEVYAKVGSRDQSSSDLRPGTGKELTGRVPLFFPFRKQKMIPNPKPVRTCVCVKALPFGAEIEIEATGWAA